MGWGVEVGGGEPQRDSDCWRQRASSFLASPAADTWIILHFFLVCLRLGTHLLMAKVYNREEKRERSYHKSLPPLPSILQSKPKARLRGRGPGVSFPTFTKRVTWVNLCASLGLSFSIGTVGLILHKKPCTGSGVSKKFQFFWPLYSHVLTPLTTPLLPPSSVLPLPQPDSAKCWEMKTSLAKRSWEGCYGPCQQPGAVRLAAFSCGCWR